MNFNDLDRKIRVYERSIDQVIVPGEYLVARLDGKCFTKLTKEVYRFEAPFDENFRDLMVDTVKELMTYGFRVVCKCYHGNVKKFRSKNVGKHAFSQVAFF